jgi:hypothetical protein
LRPIENPSETLQDEQMSTRDVVSAAERGQVDRTLGDTRNLLLSNTRKTESFDPDPTWTKVE